MDRFLSRLGPVLAAAVAVTGCNAAPAPPGSPTADTTSTLAIGMLVGTSPVDHGRELDRQRTADAVRVAGAAGQDGAHVVADAFGAGPGASRIVYNGRITSGSGQNELVRKGQLQQAKDAFVKAITTGPLQTTSPGPVDVLSGIRAMEQHLAAFPHDRTVEVVIAGSVVQTASPINLADAVQLADPATTLANVVASGLMPHCAGWRVHVVGGSLAEGGSLDALRDAQLREFWRQFFARCGGKLVLWDTVLTAFPANGDEVSPASWTRSHEVTVPLPAALLFEPDRAVLLPGAGGELDRVVALLGQTYPTATAEVAGYTAAVSGGDEDAALKLATSRAQVVAGYLQDHGIAPARLQVVGRGDQDPVAPNNTEAGRALNRRVSITLHRP